MNIWQSFLVILFCFYSLAGFFCGLKNRKNPFGLSKYFILIGAFVWVDTIIFGLFFTLISIFCLVLSQWLLFLLIISLFWVVRSIGEQIYWFLEQFASSHRNAPHTLWLGRWFAGQEVWVVMQIIWQCISVLAIFSSVILFYIFLKS